MTLDLSPNPAPAPGRVWHHATMESRLTLRNGEQLLLSLVIPIAALVIGQLTGERFGLGMDVLAPGVLAMAVWSSGFTSLAIATGYERRYGVLERLAATPLRRSGVVAGKAISTIIITAGQVVLLAAIAVALGWRPSLSLGGALVGIAGIVAALVCFAGFALALASVASAEVTLAVSNLIYLVGLFVGGILWPGQPRWTPTGAVGDILRVATHGGVPAVSLGIMALWSVAGAALAGKVLRWTA